MASTMPSLRYLLLQTRNVGDPMTAQEVRCFQRVLGCDGTAIDVFDLLSTAPNAKTLRKYDMLLLGGSGHYSAADVAENDPDLERKRSPAWLERALDAMRQIHAISKPTFASCWGFQAMARAMGGRCIHDLANAELGTIELRLTEAGRNDPVFGKLPAKFLAQAGHEDHVVELPPDAVLLASSDRVPEQAFRFEGRPIYCTQFHPELDRMAMQERVRAYPEYCTRIARVPFEEFMNGLRETPDANELLRHFVETIFG